MITVSLPIFLILCAVVVVWYLVDFGRAISKKSAEASARKARESVRGRSDGNTQT